MARKSSASIRVNDDDAEIIDAAERSRRAEMAARRRKAFGSMKGKISLSLEEALAPTDPEEIKAWGLD